MDKAPERIWVQNDTENHKDELAKLGIKPVLEAISCFQEYTRTDISNALIAAAYEAACELVAHDYVCDAIVDLTPDDARAAYDAAIRAAKIEGMREAGKAIEDAGYYCIPPYEGTGNLDQQITYSNDAITALIEETEKGGE